MFSLCITFCLSLQQLLPFSCSQISPGEISPRKIEAKANAFVQKGIIAPYYFPMFLHIRLISSFLSRSFL